MSGFLIGIGLSLAKYKPDVDLSLQGKCIIRIMMSCLPLVMLIGYLAIYFFVYKPTDELSSLEQK